jgi:hypothetical protein
MKNKELNQQLPDLVFDVMSTCYRNFVNDNIGNNTLF